MGRYLVRFTKRIAANPSTSSHRSGPLGIIRLIIIRLRIIQLRMISLMAFNNFYVNLDQICTVGIPN
jgi:hypothetical protein